MADDGEGPKKYAGVMVSSTFTDLVEHRAALIRALAGQGLHAVAMENDSARPDVDVLDSSLQMVAEAAAYAGVVGHRYGQVPEDPARNPERLSLTELELREAVRLGRPILLFLMGPRHPVTVADVELDPEARRKLDIFRESAKRFRPGSPVHRVYQVFDDLHRFEVAATKAVADLRLFLDRRENLSASAIPRPPAFYAEPPYAGSHPLSGREPELQKLKKWALEADRHPVLLLEAIGGTGKSLLAWEWINEYSTAVRQDWAGRFWYSFYERGAIMADFCRRALAYMSGRPPEDFQKKKTPELFELLLRQLRSRPWLLVLDGLERVLVSYHRLDAPQLRDEEAGSPDPIADRDPCSAIRPEDDDLLRALGAAVPSKLLISSRLVPRVLLNPSGQPIPGVRRATLEGLRPADAEAMFRACGVFGDGAAMRAWLECHCGGHPLAIGALAGQIVKDHRWGRGDFDAWSRDPQGGGRLDLARLDLVRRRNHIVLSAVEALPAKSRELLATLALLPGGVDHAALAALNPHLPKNPAERREAAALLSATLRDLEDRGLLQYDAAAARHDLHPVVRGVVAGTLGKADKEKYGERLIDYFTSQEFSIFEEAETLEDLRIGLGLVRTLLQMGRFAEAFRTYRRGLNQALIFNLEATIECLAILRSFFSDGWDRPPEGLDESARAYLATDRGMLFRHLNLRAESDAAFAEALGIYLRLEDWRNAVIAVRHLAVNLETSGRLARRERVLELAAALCRSAGDSEMLFLAELDLFEIRVTLGRWPEAEAAWRQLENRPRPRSRVLYRPGRLELVDAKLRFYRGQLSESTLAAVEKLAGRSKWRAYVRLVWRLRGLWQLERGDWPAAAGSLDRALQMAREVGLADPPAEAGLALARLHLGQLEDPLQEAERLSASPSRWEAGIASLWLALGNRERATQHAALAYELAWADGEPYVRRYYLDQARALLESLGEKPPELPRYDAAKSGKLPWEDEIAAAIASLEAEKAAKEAAPV